MTAANKQRVTGLVGLLACLSIAGIASGEPQAALVLDASMPVRAGTPVVLPIAFRYDGATISALVFSIDIDSDRLLFDPADNDMDGVPDAVTLPAGMPSIAYIGYDPDGAGGEIDIMLANLSGAPLPQGVILEIELTSTRRGFISNRIRFSDDPTASFGTAQGGNVDGITHVLGHQIFADGFESGDTGAWSITKSTG